MRPPSAPQEADRGSVRRSIALVALALFVLSIPTDNLATLPGVGSPSRLLGLLAALVTIPALTTRDGLRIRLPAAILVVSAAMFFWWLLSYFWSIDGSVTLSRSFSLAQTILLMWLVHELCRNLGQLGRLMSAYVIGCYVLLGYVFYIYFSGASEGFRDVGAFNANDATASIAVGIPMAWYVLHSLSNAGARSGLLWRLNQLAMAAFPFVALAGLMVTVSRGGLVATLAGLSIIPLALNQVSWRRRALLLVAISAGIIALVVYLPRLFPDIQDSIARLSTTTEEVAGGTLTGRTVIWEAGLELFAERPVHGWGAGAFRSAIKQLSGTSAAAHSAFISVAAETGAVGLALFLAVFGLAAHGALTAPKSLRPFLLVLMLTVLITMIPGNIEVYKFVWFSFAVATATTRLTFFPAGGARISRLRTPSLSGSPEPGERWGSGGG